MKHKYTFLLQTAVFGLVLLASHATRVEAQSNTFPATGNVGIGTTTPDTKLVVTLNTGTLPASGGIARFADADSVQTTVFLDGFDVNGGFLVRRANTSAATPSAVFSGNLLGVFGAAGYHGSAYSGTRARIAFGAAENWTNSANGTFIAFNTTANGSVTGGGTERMRIDSSGKVGIGTSNPTRMLEVAATDGEAMRLYRSVADTGSGVNLKFAFDNSSGAAVDFAGLYGIKESPTAGAEAGSLVFSTATNGSLTEKIRVLSSGNVGIGTASPLARLHLFSGGTTDHVLQNFQNGTRNWTIGINGAGDFFRITDNTANVARLAILNSGNVGIGTTTPTTLLDVNGEIRSRSGGFRFPDGSLQDKAAAVTSMFGRTGAVVPATDDYTWAQINKMTSSLGDLATRNAGDLNAGLLQAARMPALTGDVTSSAGTTVTALTSTGVTAGSYTNANITVDAKGRITAASNGSGGSTAFSNITAGTNTVALLVGNGGSLGVSGTGTINATSLTNAANITSGTVPITRLGTGTSDSTKFLRGDNTWTPITSSQWTTSGSNINYATAGNVGIGTSTPTSRLHVVGDGKFTGNLTVDGSINAKYQDVAEWVPSTHALPAGTVVTLDPTKSNHVEASSKAYDTRVAGVVSAQPGIALGEEGQGKVLVATTGRVKIKVDASHGPIEVGDLLVSSNVPGVAMKSKPIDVGGVEIHRPGTLIGKALEPLATGQCEILVLLSLQ